MAAAKKGLLAILAGGEPGDEEAESDAGDAPLDAKKRALQDMFASLGIKVPPSADWDGAAMAFKDAYDACAMAGGEDDEEDGGMEY